MALQRLLKPLGRAQPADLSYALGDWFQEGIGEQLLEKEKLILKEVLSKLFGYHILYTGLSSQTDLIGSSPIKNKISLYSTEESPHLIGCSYQLPLKNDSTDVVVMHHSLDYEKDPYQVLREATRTIIPNGNLIIIGFNPWSLWGLWRALLFRSVKAPWSARFVSPYRLSDWLNVLDFDVAGCESGFYMPPLASLGEKESLNWIDKTGSAWLSQRGGFYVLMAKKRVSCITPVRIENRVSRKTNLVPLPAAGRVDNTFKFNKEDSRDS